MDNLEEIKILIETNYNLSVEKVSNITSKSLKVSTAQHEYVLKLAEGNDEFIMKQLFAYKSLPKNILPIYRTRDRQHLVPCRGQFFYLTDYVQIIAVPLEKQLYC